MKTNDNTTRLKTYKIKNHDSGQTYRVNAVSYTDAIKKYNEHISDELQLVEKIGDYTIKKNDDDFLKFAVFYKGQIIAETTTVAIAKRQIKQHMNDSLTEDGWSSYTFKTGIRSDAFKQYLRDRGIYFEASQNREYTHFEVKNADEAVDRRANEIVRQLKDSITEDAETLFTASIVFASDKPKTKGTNKGYTGGSYGGGSFNVNQTIGDVITNFYNSMKKDFDDAASANIRVKKLSIIPYTRGNRNPLRQSMNIREVEGKAVQSAIQIGNSIKLSKYMKDSITEDADIAQNDIKSSYLPEDANADNIQYLGFNEKRKLSFYGYGDRYFVHYDLEGRTEEIDKATVQKILKKNILGEIDENDLINKEPQSEEIVSDAFDWKKQERGDR